MYICVRKYDLRIFRLLNGDTELNDTEELTWVELPEGLDPDCVKAVLVDDVITLIEDDDKVAAKAQAAKLAQVEALHAALNAEVYAEMARIYQTTNPDSATAFHETWKLMKASPSDFVTVSGLADAVAVEAFADAKLAEVKTYAVWRLQKINEFMAAKAAILA